MDRKDKARKNSSSSSSAASMAALAAAAAAGDGGAALPSPMEEDKKPRLAASSLVPVAGGVGGGSSSSASAAAGASSSSSSSSVAAAARRGAGRAGGGAPASGGGGGGGPRCQVERCGVDLSEAGRYNRRHKVCQTHSKEPVVLVAGLRQRFCQQCTRFHELTEFDDAKRSCRRRLAGHNERRRKSAADTAHGENCRHADQDGRSHQGTGNPPFQIR